MLRPKDLDREKIIEIFSEFDAGAISTRFQRSVAMRQYLRYLRDEHEADRLVQWVPRCPKPAPRNVTARTEERAAIMASANDSLRCWLLLCSDLAIRSGTAARLTPENYDPQKGTLSFKTKYQASLTLPVTNELAALLSSASKRGDATMPFVALLHPLKRCSKVTLTQQFQRLRKRLGIERKLTPHDLRRTTAVAIMDITKDLRLVQALLGHRSLQSTLYYLDHRNTPVPVSTLELAKLNPASESIQ